MLSTLRSLSVLCLLCTTTATAEDLTLETAPPVVVKTTPEAGSSDVDPALTEVRVVFSKEMSDGSWSVVQDTEATFPKIDGQFKYEPGRRTFVLPVKLEPGRNYAVWLNRGRFTNFKDADRRPAVPYLLVFRTKGAANAAAAAPKVTRAQLEAAFDALWEDMGRHYSYLQHKQIDWQAWKATHRDEIVAAGTLGEFLSRLSRSLAELRDGHVWIESSGRRGPPAWIPPERARNVNHRATLAALDNVRHCGRFAAVGTTRGDGFGAVVVLRQSDADEESVQQVVEFVRGLDDAPGCLVDLRAANGGNELLAQEIAREFCEREVVYAASKYRKGPDADDFGLIQPRILPAGQQPFLRPVVCLVGWGCVSSGEGFAKMMAALPHVTLVGEPTRGSSGNPRPFRLPGLDVSVWYSRWVDLLPDGTTVEDKGVIPDEAVTFPAEAYTEADPTWDHAIEVLKKQTIARARP
jgi:RNA polymerase sigma-70 factor (ECF subfamily)